MLNLGYLAIDTLSLAVYMQITPDHATHRPAFVNCLTRVRIALTKSPNAFYIQIKSKIYAS